MNTLPLTSSAATGQDQGFALDMQSLERMRRAARKSPEEGLKQVARQFESMFMGMMLKSMRDATPTSGLLESEGGKMYQSMLDQQLSQHLSGRGLKLADAMFAQLRRTLPVAGTAPPATGKPSSGAALAPGAAELTVAAMPRAAAAPIAVRPQNTAAPTAVPAEDLASSSIASAIRAPQAIGKALPPLGSEAPAATQDTKARGLGTELRAHVQGFLERIGNAARTASAASGVPTALIVAQAALESGWGRHEIRGDNGSPSFNLFGIKADKSWRGPVTEATTTEFIDGVARRVRAKFRAYASYQEAFADYASFLAKNP